MYQDKSQGKRLAKASLAKNNNITVNVLGDYENDRSKFQSMSNDLGITFDSNNNVLFNTIKLNTNTNTSNISNINSKFSSSYSGSVTVITGVDFTAKTTTTKTLTIVDGLITGVA